MITPELIAYIKSELGKGKTREDVRVDLLANGGWTDADLSEAFKSVMPISEPLQSLQPKEPLQQPSIPIQKPESTPVMISPDLSTPSPDSKKPARKTPWVAITLAILFAAVCFFAFYFFSPQILDLPNKAVSVVNSLMGNNMDNEVSPDETLIPQDETPISLITDTTSYINCGITITPNRNDFTTYLADDVFKCLGESALSCENAEAVINDTLLPTIFKIKNENNECRFELSYKMDSSLTDIFGRKLAGRNISCPITITRSFSGIDSKDFIFSDTDVTKPSKYAADMYFYGTVGVFFDKDFNQSAIEELGCRGTFLDSAVESFSLIKSKI